MAWIRLLFKRGLPTIRVSTPDRQESVRHIGRLAGEMRDAVQSVEDDLDALGLDSTTEPLHARCLKYRLEVAEILADTEALDCRSSRHVARLLDKLRNDHRRVVNLRSDVDRMLLVRRRGHAGRLPASGTRRSSWSSSGFHTRPSTVM